jgi:hypothetical protein
MFRPVRQYSDAERKPFREWQSATAKELEKAPDLVSTITALRLVLHSATSDVFMQPVAPTEKPQARPLERTHGNEEQWPMS